MYRKFTRCCITTIRRLKPVRYFSSDFKELKIPTPWGHIAAKDWGPPDGTPVLAVHGWQDNAGSFDVIKPYLPKHIRLVAMDLSGHGLSSHRPPGTYYGWLDYVTDMYRVTKFLNWNNNKFWLLGHSLGAALSVLYTSYFPDHIEKLVAIEYASPPKTNAQFIFDTIPPVIDYNSKVFSNSLESAPTYTREEARKLLIEGSFNSLMEKSAEVIMKRGVIPVENDRVKFSRDFLVKKSGAFIVGYDYDVRVASFENVKCEFLSILANDKLYTHVKDPGKIYHAMHKANCKYFKSVLVDGNHHVHLNNPENVAPHIYKFFQKPSS